MAVIPSLSLSVVDLILTIASTAVTIFLGFVGMIWYLGLDRQTRSYDKEIRSDIEREKAFSGIRSAARTKFVATSPNRVSRLLSTVQRVAGVMSDKPHKIVTVQGQSIEERKIEMIRERVREMPGRNILRAEFIGAIRNHYAITIALSQEDVGSAVVEHFQANLENYQHAQKVIDLADEGSYENVCLFDSEQTDEQKDALNDIFLRLVEAAERFCVSPISDPDDQRREIETCRELIMLAFFSLWTQRMKGVEVGEDMEEDYCISAYRDDIRDEENWGYWLLPERECGQDEFERIQHLGWRVDDILEQYWGEEIYSKL